MISFDNTEIAFKGKSNADLRRAFWLFKVVGRPMMVKFGKWFTKLAFNLRLPIKGIIRRTIYRQFCGGESISDSLKTIHQLAEREVKTILDYSIEGQVEEEEFEKTVLEIIGTIREAKINANIPFAVFKVSGICLIEILEGANDSVANLTDLEKVQYDKLTSRTNQICQEAYNNGIPLFFDAEESWIQNSIDRLVKEMCLKYNREKAIIYNTIQMYRHDRLEFFKNEIEDAKNNGYKLGMKLVRGAYMEKERARAIEKKYISPIQVDKGSCDRDFDAALELAIQNIDTVSFCNGTHNEDSSIYLIKLMTKYNIPANDERVYFAQLLGMSDHISFNLADCGYNVAKYVPYGPIKEVLPYLIRRADENTSVAGQTSRELTLIIKERTRRKNL